MQSTFKPLSALPLSARTEINIFLFTNHRNKESTPCLCPHHVTLTVRRYRAPAAKDCLGKWLYNSPRSLLPSFFLWSCNSSGHLPSVAGRTLWYQVASKQGKESLWCVTNNYSRYSSLAAVKWLLKVTSTHACFSLILSLDCVLTGKRQKPGARGKSSRIFFSFHLIAWKNDSDCT